MMPPTELETLVGIVEAQGRRIAALEEQVKGLERRVSYPGEGI